MNKDRKVDEHDIIIKFPNENAAKHFAIWLCESGEQQYWDWMEYRENDDEEEDKGIDITVVDFEYHGKEDKTKKKNDPKRYGEFMADNTIRTTCGRLDREYE